MESTTTLQDLPRLRPNPCCLRRCRALVGVSAMLWAAQAWGQTPFLTTSDFALALQRQAGGDWVDMPYAEAATYLNQARCQCATPVQIVVQMAAVSRSKLSSLTMVGTQARLYVGTNCANLNGTGTGPQCPDSQMLGEINGITMLSQGPWAVPTSVDKLFAAAGDCAVTRTTAIWLWLDSTGTGRPDDSVTGGSAPSLGIELDGTAPPAPSGITVEASDQAMMVSWTPLSAADWPDLAGYLVFCMRERSELVYIPSYYDNQYLTGQRLCGAPFSQMASTPSSAAGNTTAVEVVAPPNFQGLYPDYLCSGLLPPTQTSARLGIPGNGIPYTVGVAAVDYDGNASPIRSGFVQVSVQVSNATGGNTPVQVPDDTGGNTGHLGRSGCSCHFVGVDRGAVPWGAMLVLGLARRLRRRGKRQRRSS